MMGDMTPHPQVCLTWGSRSAPRCCGAAQSPPTQAGAMVVTLRSPNPDRATGHRRDNTKYFLQSYALWK